MSLYKTFIAVEEYTQWEASGEQNSMTWEIAGKFPERQQAHLKAKDWPDLAQSRTAIFYQNRFLGTFMMGMVWIAKSDFLLLRHCVIYGISLDVTKDAG